MIKFIWLCSLLMLASCADQRHTEISSPQVKNDSIQAANLNVQLALAFMNKGNMKKAKEKLIIAKKEAPKEPSVWCGSAYYLEKTGDLNNAAKLYRKAISLNVWSGSAHNNFGAFLCRQGHYHKAIKEFMLATKDSNYFDKASAFENAGVCALRIPDQTLALHFFNLALDHGPNSPNVLFYLSRIHYFQNHLAKAMRFITRYEDIMDTPSSDALWLHAQITKNILFARP